MKFNHKITLEEIQQLEYDILKEFDNFARENHLKYFLCGGTLLGAVRHKDFIPWDDDIDICLLRDDYDKLLSLVENNRTMKNKRYRFCLPFDDNYIYPYIKVVDDNTIVYEKDIDQKFCSGVWIDVFPMDTWPESSEEIKNVLKKHNRYKFFNKIYVSGNLKTTKKKIMAKIGKFGYKILFPRKTSKYWVKKMLTLIKPSNGCYVGNRSWPTKDREMFNKSVFSDVLYQPFRDRNFPIPKGYDEYLTKMYGDYMKLPKPEDRIYHDFEGYIIDDD